MTTLAVPARNLTLVAHFGASKHASALSTLYWALFTGDPFGTGVEPSSAGNYSRAATLNDAGLWGTISSTATSVKTVAAITWPVASGPYSVLGPYTFWACFDAPTGGNLWYTGALGTPIPTTASGDQPRIPAAALTINQGG